MVPIESTAKQWNRIRNSLVPPRSLVLLSIFLAYLSRRLYIQSSLEHWNRGIYPRVPAFKSNRKTSTGCLPATLATAYTEGGTNSLWLEPPRLLGGRVAERRQKGYAEKYLHWAECFFTEFTEPDIVSFRGKTGQVAFSLTAKLYRRTPWLDHRKSQPSRFNCTQIWFAN